MRPFETAALEPNPESRLCCFEFRWKNWGQATPRSSYAAVTAATDESELSARTAGRMDSAMSEDILSRKPPAADARLTYGSDPNQFIDLRLPGSRIRKPYPLVINIHGGFWRARYNLDTPDIFVLH